MSTKAVRPESAPTGKTAEAVRESSTVGLYAKREVSYLLATDPPGLRVYADVHLGSDGPIVQAYVADRDDDLSGNLEMSPLAARLLSKILVSAAEEAEKHAEDWSREPWKRVEADARAGRLLTPKSNGKGVRDGK